MTARRGRGRSGARGQAERGALVVQHAGDDPERLAGHLEQPLDGVAGVAHAHAGEPRADDKLRDARDADGPRAHGARLDGRVKRRALERTRVRAEGRIHDPPVERQPAHAETQARVVAWLWARETTTPPCVMTAPQPMLPSAAASAASSSATRMNRSWSVMMSSSVLSAS